MNPVIRPATLADIDAMQQIEIASGELWAAIGMQDIADDGAHETELLECYVHDAQAWVAVADGAVCGYAIADVIDGNAHLEQVTVRPEFGRRGIGRQILDEVIAWARAQQFRSITLLTFRDVAWNGPYYARLGFVEIADAELGPELAALRTHEATLGLDVSSRMAMRLSL